MYYKKISWRFWIRFIDIVIYDRFSVITVTFTFRWFYCKCWDIQIGRYSQNIQVWFTFLHLPSKINWFEVNYIPYFGPMGLATTCESQVGMSTWWILSIQTWGWLINIYLYLRRFRVWSECFGGSVMRSQEVFGNKGDGNWYIFQ